MEWGIGGLKFKMEKVNEMLGKNSHLFKVVILLTKTLPRHCQDFTFEIIGKH